MFAVVGDDPVMSARLITRGAGGEEDIALFETRLAPLVNAAAPDRFRF
jgi:protein-L-isoaspartate(D-aspartate) O-methyltransferase